MTRTLLRRTGLVALTLWLAACAGTSGPGMEGSWSRIGEANDGNLSAYLDKSSIQRNGDLVTFRDRKVINKPAEERYVNTPRYKTAIGSWEFNCRNKTYRLTSLSLFDKDGKPVSQQTYTARDLRPMQIMSGSLTEKQFQTVCQ